MNTHLFNTITHRTARMACILLALLTSTVATAKDYISESYAMMAYTSGAQGAAKVKIMFDDWGGAHYYVDTLVLYAKYVENGQVYTKNLAYLRSGSGIYENERYDYLCTGSWPYYIDNIYYAPTLWCGLKCVAGSILVTNGYGQAYKNKYGRIFYPQTTYKIAESSIYSKYTACWVKNDANGGEPSGQVYVEFEWYPPISLAGKDIDLYVDYKAQGAASKKGRKLTSAAISIPQREEVLFMVEPMLSTDAEHPQQTMITYYATKKLTSEVVLHYTDEAGQPQTVRQLMPSSNMNGTFYLPCDKSYKNVYLTSSYEFSSGNNQDVITDVIPVVSRYHQASAPTVVPLADGKGSLQVSWTVPNATDNDLWSGIDFFLVERAFKADYSDATQIQALTYEDGKAEYSIKDSTNLFIRDWDGTQSPRTVYYRISRMSARAWNDKMPVTTIGYSQILAPAYYQFSYDNQYSNDPEKEVGLAIKPMRFNEMESNGQGGTIQYVWDDAWQYTLQAKGYYTDSQGTQRDRTLNIPVDEEALKQGHTSISLLPCLKYDSVVCHTDYKNMGNFTEPDRKVPFDTTFYYNEAGQVSQLEASKGYYSDKVVLKWTTDGGLVDHFNIRRKEYGSTQWETIATNVTAQLYQDTQLAKGVEYLYSVEACYQCEDQVIAHVSPEAHGFSAATGTVEGYVRFPDNTGMPGVELQLTSTSKLQKNGVAYFVRKGEAVNGYYTQDHIQSNTPLTTPQDFTWKYTITDIQGQCKADRGYAIVSHGRISLNAKFEEDGWTPEIYILSSPSAVNYVKEISIPKKLPYAPQTHVLTCQGSTGQISLYVNGQLFYQFEDPEIQKLANEEDYVSLGGRPFNDSRLSNALSDLNTGDLTDSYQYGLDNFGIWNRLFTAEEVAQQHNTKINSKEQGLVLYWDFDDRLPSTIYINDIDERDTSRNGIVSDHAYNTDLDAAHHDATAYKRFWHNDGVTQGVSYIPSFNQRFDITIPETCYCIKGLTNETGYYRISGIPYQGETTYVITPQAADGQKYDPEGGISVTFDDAHTDRTDYTFSLTSYYRYNGVVLYEGSSIPVPDARFMLNGHEVQRNNKPLTTNTQGEFEFYVPRGTNTIQVVKEGHTFKNDGYLLNDEGGRDVVFERNRDEVRLWDQTKVRLMGRMVGGNTEGLKALGRSLSQNNLGDSLRIVLQLEGDNTSWIVKEQNNDEVKTRDRDFTHHNSKYSNHVTYERHRIIITPNPTTGEYIAELYPVKYKVVETSAEGYPTLFQEGKVGETLNLTDSVHTCYDTATYAVAEGDTITDTVAYGARYDRIYRSAINVTYEQVNATGSTLFGDEYHWAARFADETIKVPLYNAKTGTYTFGHPVFTAGTPYIFKASVHEDYYYNNDRKNGTYTSSPITMGQLRINNGFSTASETTTLELDSLGICLVPVTVNNVTYTMTGDDALRQFSITAVIDGTAVESEQLEAFIMGNRSKEQGWNVLTGGPIQLVDILRDPPGSGSSAWIEKGSSTSFSYNFDVSFEAGFNLSIDVGKNASTYVGSIVGGVSEAGTMAGYEHLFGTNFDISTGYGISTDYTYKMDYSDRVSTSSDPSMVGRDADIFLGVEHGIRIQPAVSVRAINQKLYNQLKGKESTGGLKVIAQTTMDGDTYYLVRDEVISTGSEITADFAYTAKYIEDTLIPDLIKQRNALLFCGTLEEAQAKADREKAIVYWTKLSPDDEHFGHNNVDSKDNVITFNYSDPDNRYMMVKPTTTTTIKVISDQIYDINQRILQWYSALLYNEQEKVEARDPIATYSVSGGTSRSYSESFEAEESNSRYIQVPFQSFDPSIVSDKLGFTPSDVKKEEKTSGNKIKVEVTGTKVEIGFTPILKYDIKNPMNGGQSVSMTKSTGFDLEVDDDSNLTVEVYRTQTPSDTIQKWIESGVAHYNNYHDFVEYVYNRIDKRGAAAFTNGDDPRFGNLVFKTVGGATACPYEDERRAKYYKGQPVLDAKTLKIENPKISVDRRSISDVPYDKAATFNLRLTNESELPDAASEYFNLYQVETMNQHGAKLSIDGVPLSSGRTIHVPAGEVVNKVLEVRCGDGYDFNDLGIGISSTCDKRVNDTVNIAVHFIPSAGELNLATPTKGWVMNTESPTDPTGYYLPVRIDGFNTDQRGFDHIELQYKLTTKPEKDWVNVCSFYNDSTLYAAASGTKEMIGNGGYISTRFFGEADPIEQQYDLRAVTYCRYGNGYITASTPIMTGIKDTRRPMPFGNVQPANGVLGIGDDIVIRFSESIAGNYLSKVNNFDVTGYMNSTEITQSTSLRFSGDTYASTEVLRNLSEKDLTIEMLAWPNLGKEEMTLFSHLDDNEHLSFRITPEGKLKAVINGSEFVTNEAISFNTFKHVAMTLDASTHQVRFFNGNRELTHNNGLAPAYSGQSELFFGGDNQGTGQLAHPYVGNMLEARLWNKVLTANQLGSMSFKRLSGYEAGLVDYYPMNEGRGTYLHDKGQGATATLNQASWTLPEGMSLRFDGTHDGVQLNERYLSRTDQQDYTLQLWFKAELDNGEAALISAGSGQPDEPDAANKFYIGLDNGMLVYRSNGIEQYTTGQWNDGRWHQYALTVNRTRNVANIYVDNTLRNTFNVDTLGGISSNRIYLGAIHLNQGQTDSVAHRFKGWIDEVSMWNAAIPGNVLNDMYNVCPDGTELALMAWMHTYKNERKDDNTWHLVYTPESGKRYKDLQGNITSQRDTLLLTDASAVVVDKKEYAPIRDMGMRENIKFSYTAKDDELVVNLDVPDKDVEGTTVYVTVKDVADLNGNEMASPVMMSVYVNRNDVVWEEKELTINKEKYSYTDYDQTIHIVNRSGKKHSFSIEGAPDWMTISPMQGSIGALGNMEVTITIKEGLNVGTYDEVLYVVNDNGVSSALNVKVKVIGEKPAWSVDKGKYTESMNLCGRLRIKGALSTDPDDVVAVFHKSECIGMANNTYDEQTGQCMVYLTLYSAGKFTLPLVTKVWDASSGVIYQADLMQDGKALDLTFGQNMLVGSTASPVVIDAGEKVNQAIDLDEGWNWVSFNVYNEGFKDLKKTLSFVEATEGEAFKSPMENYFLTYYKDKWMNTSDTMSLRNDYMYQVYVKQYKTVNIVGTLVKEEKDRTLIIRPNWNHIGYTPAVNLKLNEALASYYDDANDGDIIKSQDEFAIFTVHADGQRRWEGNLEYMRPGEGYVFKRNSDEPAMLVYPYVEPGSSFYATNEPEYANSHSGSMALVAKVTGFDFEEGDCLVAYAGGEVCARTTLHTADSLCYLNIGGDDTATLQFAIERDGQTVATAATLMEYVNNGLSGHPDQPTAIDFAEEATGAIIGPNPFSTELRFSAATTAADEVVFSLYTTTGTRLYRHSTTATGQLTQHTWTGCQGLADGVYVGVVEVNGKAATFKLLKR